MNAFDPVKADKITAFMINHLGDGEVPPGSNRGPLPDEAFHFIHGAGANPGNVSMEDREWCAELACLAVFKAGISSGPKTASTGGVHDWGRAHDKIVTNDDPRAGDIGCVIEDPRHPTPTGFRHCVIVEHNFGGSDIHCVGGNEGDMVSRSLRPKSSMKFVRPY